MAVRKGGFFIGISAKMLKRFFLALGLIAGLLSPSYGAGTIPLSLSQRFDNTTHLPLAGGQLFFIQAGTTSTPQNAFQDSALTLPYPNPLTLDTGGNIPQLFFADGQIKIRLANAAGVTQLSVDNIQVVGASSGGGGGGTVDPTTILATGDIKATYGTGVLTGFVRLNGRTIGSASSGATERANADTQALFQYLWGADPNLVVSTGRGVSANADWVANKQITLPDWRGRALAALDDMGNTAAGRLTTTYFGATATVLGAAGGLEQSPGLLTTNLPPYTPTGVIVNGSIVSTVTGGTFGSTGSLAGVGTGATIAMIGTTPITVTSTQNPTGFFGLPQGGASTPFAVASPMMLATFYLKL